MDQAAGVPAAVKAAIASFEPDAESGFTLAPPSPKDNTKKSVIYSYGVRVHYKNAKDQSDELGWICLGSQECREKWSMYPLYGGKTSNATKHLKDVHSISSEKTLVEIGRKRSREEEVEELRNSPMFRNDPKRLRLLLETRSIVLNNKAFCSGEHKDAKIINDLMIVEQFRTSVNPKAVGKTIIELYAAVKREVIMQLKRRSLCAKSLTLVLDFWTCQPQHAKYLGVRVYFVDDKWTRKSVLLGVRLFDPTCAKRVKGFRVCFLDWLTKLLEDFDIKNSDIFAAMTDGARDVKGLVQDELKVPWEWCIPHMMNAASKWACGMNDNVKESKNPELTKLIESIRRTIRQVRDVEQMGTLFQALCMLEGTEKARIGEDSTGSKKLLDYQSHRFLGFKLVLERLLEKWEPLRKYYAVCAAQPPSAKAPTTFLLAKHRKQITQILSLIAPIATLNTMSQAESPNQAKCILLLFQIRRVTLDPDTALRHYKSEPKNPMHIGVDDLTELTKRTRSLLAEALDKRFFYRYTDVVARQNHRFVFECQLFLHPRYKDLDENLAKMVHYSVKSTGGDSAKCRRVFDAVKASVVERVRKSMRETKLDPVEVTLAEVDDDFQSQERDQLSLDLEEYSSATAPAQSVVVPQEIHEARVEEELQRWLAIAPINVDSALPYWEQQAGDFRYLSAVAKALYAFPTSSAQIERDFGETGKTVTKDRVGLHGSSVEMSSFIKANESFLSLTQCDKIPTAELGRHIPRHMVDIDEDEWDELPQVFSSMSCEGDQDEV